MQLANMIQIKKLVFASPTKADKDGYIDLSVRMSVDFSEIKQEQERDEERNVELSFKTTRLINSLKRSLIKDLEKKDGDE